MKNKIFQSRDLCLCALDTNSLCAKNVRRKEVIMKKTYKVEVDCANCAAKMEEAVKATAGVKDATLSFMTLKLKVEFEDGADVDAVMQDALKNCKKVEDDCEIFL